MPTDLQIVCGEFNIESPQPENLSVENERVLDIKRIINHPRYKPNRGPGEGGPIEGNDICVYLVEESNFYMGNYHSTLKLCYIHLYVSQRRGVASMFTEEKLSLCQSGHFLWMAGIN